MPNKKKKKTKLKEQVVNNKKTIFDYQSDYYYFTGEASKINRQLILASIAVIWIFRISADSQSIIPEALLGTLYWLFASLALDFLQYLSGSAIWGIFFSYLEGQEKKGKITLDDDIQAPIILPIIINIFFWLKLIVGFIAYSKLLIFLNCNIGIY